MNREIRFRWRDGEKMFEVTGINFDYKEVFGRRAEDKPKENGCACCDPRNDDWYDMNKVKLMQRTWLTDKNWTDIYEGDVVKFIDHIGVESRWEICWYKTWWWWLGDYEMFLYDFFVWIDEENEDLWKYLDLEVIWNNRQHPELLSTP